MRRLLERARQLIAEKQCLLRRLHDGTWEMRCPVPAGYVAGIYPRPDELRGRMSATGWLFEISECSGGSSGGYLASTIPPSWYQRFLSAWCAFASATEAAPSEPMQLDLFAA